MVTKPFSTGLMFFMDGKVDYAYATTLWWPSIAKAMRFPQGEVRPWVGGHMVTATTIFQFWESPPLQLWRQTHKLGYNIISCHTSRFGDPTFVMIKFVSSLHLPSLHNIAYHNVSSNTYAFQNAKKICATQVLDILTYWSYD